MKKFLLMIGGFGILTLAPVLWMISQFGSEARIGVLNFLGNYRRRVEIELRK